MADEYESEEIESEEQPRRRLAPLIGLLLLVIVIIIVIFMLKDCGSVSDGESSERGEKRIEAVEGYAPIPGAVSLWIKEDSSIESVLGFADADVNDYVDLGGGRFVLDVQPGSERAAIEELQEIPGVYDAGWVYENPK